MKRRKKQMPSMGMLSTDYSNASAFGIILKIILALILTIAFYMNC